MNIYLSVKNSENEEANVYCIKDANDDHIKWLNLFALKIGKCEISTEMTKGIQIGVFNYIEFRAFLREIGYTDDVEYTDLIYRNAIQDV